MEAGVKPIAPECPSGRSRKRDLFSSRYAALREEYRGIPIDVSFRHLASPHNAEEDSHKLHPYPAKLLRHIPHFMLGCNQIAVPGDLVCDPFCGSGTILDEARRWAMNAIGIDLNPVAINITKNRIGVLPSSGQLNDTQVFGNVVNTANTFRSNRNELPRELEFWYGSEALRALGHLRRAIHQAENQKYLDFLNLALSVTTNAIAWKDPRIPVPVRTSAARTDLSRSKVFSEFYRASVEAWNRLCLIHGTHGTGYGHAILGDARGDLVSLTTRPNVLMTSPPYGAAQKYARSSSHSLAVLNLASHAEIRELSYQLVGRERVRNEPATQLALPVPILDELEQIEARDPYRRRIYQAYFSDMSKVFQESASVLPIGGPLVLVSSSNTIAGKEVQTHQLLVQLAEGSGFVVEIALRDKILARSLLTRRAKTAGQPIMHEYVYVLRRTAP